MKKKYRTPKAVMVDFNYDEQVVAASSDVAFHGDPPPQLGKCRQSSETSCSIFWTVGVHDACSWNPFSLRKSL